MSVFNKCFHSSPLVTVFVTLITLAAGIPQDTRAQTASTTELEVVHESEWPREIVTTRGVIVMYQPEPEWFEGNRTQGACSSRHRTA